MFIERAELFQGMSSQFMDAIARCFVEETFEPGTFLFNQGDAAAYFHVLEEGRVRISYGQEGHIAFVASKVGEAFGWSSLLGGERYVASAECISRVRVSRVAGSKLDELFGQDPASGLIFYKRLARLIQDRLVNFYRVIPAAHGQKRVAPGF